MDKRVKGWVADKVVGDVNEEAFVRTDGRGKRVEDVGKGRQGSGSKFVTLESSAMHIISCAIMGLTIAL